MNCPFCGKKSELYRGWYYCEDCNTVFRVQTTFAIGEEDHEKVIDELCELEEET